MPASWRCWRSCSFSCLAAGDAAVEKLPGRQRRLVGLANYVRYFTTPTLVASLWNSLAVAVLATATVVPLAFLYAYGLTRTCMPAKACLWPWPCCHCSHHRCAGHLADLHLWQPGFLKGWLLGGSIYGPFGIVIAQVFYCFPMPC